MSTKKMYELVVSYRIPLGYLSRISSNGEYVSILGPLEVNVCEESFWASFHISIHPFIERLLYFLILCISGSVIFSLSGLRFSLGPLS